MASLKQTLLLYVKILAGASACSYSYLYYHCKKLREEAQNQELINAKKDTTRPNNVYYGLNWGYRSDNTIEKSLDTGDLLFINYNCMNCFNPSDVIKCYAQQKTLKNEGDPQNVAFCFRTPKKLLIITSHFDGEIQMIPYHEFINKPFIKTVKVRSFVNAPVNIVENSTAFVQQIREQKQRTDNDHTDMFTQFLRMKIVKKFYFDKIAQNIVPHYLSQIKVLNRHPFEKPYVTVQDIDTQRPDVFQEAYELSGPVMVRTYASQNLMKANST